MAQEKKVKRIQVFDFVTLEANEGDTQSVANRIIVDTYFSDQLNLVCKYTTGTGETNNNAYIKVWGYVGIETANIGHPYNTTVNADITGDTNNWIQLGTYDTSSGTSTFTASIFKIAGASAATAYDAHFALGFTFPKIRVSAYEDGVSSNKGRLDAFILIQ